MLVKFTNRTPATRVLYDINNVMRTIPPGKSLEVEVTEKVGKNYWEAMKKGNQFLIDVLDDSAEGAEERALDPAETFTLRPDDERHPSRLKEPLSLKEARGPQGNQNPVPPEPPNPSPEIHHDPIHHAAEQAAKTEAEPTETVAEPKTAADLLAVLTDYNDTDQVRLANAILAPKKLPLSAKPAQIVNALKAKMQRDAETEQPK